MEIFRRERNFRLRRASFRRSSREEIAGFDLRSRRTADARQTRFQLAGYPTRLQSRFNDYSYEHSRLNGFGKEFEDADNREKRGDAVKDIQALLDWVGKQPDLDANQIFLRGESYGGFIVLSTALQEPTRIKGVIAEYPLVSIRGFLSQSWIDEYARTEYGDPKDENLLKRLDELSPLNNVSRWNNIPLFLTRGKLDQRNPEKDVTDLKTQLQNKNSEVWFIYSNEDGHGFSGKYVTAAMFKFLKTQISKEQ